MGTAAAKDEYSVPPTDACYGVVEGFKRYTGDRIDDYFHAFQYQQLGDTTEQLLQCCPAFREKVAKIRSPYADPEALRHLEFPTAVLSPESTCIEPPFSSRR